MFPVHAQCEHMFATLFDMTRGSIRVLMHIRDAAAAQCGGNGGTCFGGACADAPWDNACCMDPLTRCFRYNAAYWECRWGPFGPATT